MGGYQALEAGHLLLGKYRIEQKLGEGGMAEIYHASSRGAAGFERPVVIKVIKPELVATPGMVEQFVREASVGSVLQHPNIVSVFDLGEAEGVLYMVMEYVQGKDLAALIHKARSQLRVLSPEMIAYICIDVCKALECSHGHVDEDATPRPIVHRDVSPQNILLAMDGTVKLADFGMARALGSSRLTAVGTVKGKLSYMSPEQSRGKDVDARSDLFSVGIVMWESMTGQRLFLSKDPMVTIKKVRAAEAPRLDKVATHVKKELADIVHRLLSVKPEDRYQSASELRLALQTFLRSTKVIDATSLSDLLEVYFPAEVLATQTAVPELSFSDEGEGSVSSPEEVLEEDFRETLIDTSPEQNPAPSASPHTLLMFGKQGEELAETFKKAQAAAEERRRSLTEKIFPPKTPHPQPVQASQGKAKPSIPTMIANPHEQSDTKKTSSTPPPGLSGGTRRGQAHKTPPTIVVAPSSENPMMIQPDPVQQQAIHPTPQPPRAAAQMSDILPTPSPALPESPPADSKGRISNMPLIMSLLIGIPLGTGLGLLVFWLLTR